MDILSYPGTASPGNRVVPEMVPSTLTINQQILADLMNGKSWLFDLLSHLRDGMKLSHNGLQTSLGYNVATMVASVHAGRSLVLDNCVQNDNAKWIQQFKNSKYNGANLFGGMPGSSRATYNRLFDSLGQVRLRDGEVIKTGSSCKDLKTKSKSSSSSPSNAKILEVLASKKSKANQPFRYYKRGKAPYTDMPTSTILA